jgi:hypothetical protein
VVQHLGSDLEALLRVEAEDFLHRGNFFRAEGGAVDLAGVLLLRCRPADDGPQRNNGRLGGFGLRGLEGVVQLLDVFFVIARLRPVHTLGVPAIGLVALEHVFRERNVGVVLDGDVVLVVEHHEVAQFLVSRQRRGFRRHAFLQVAIRGDDPDGVVERAFAGGSIGVVKTAGAALRVSEAHRGRQALAQRAGGDFDAGRVPELGVSRSQRVPRPEPAQILDFQAVPGEEELDVERERRVPGGEDEAVAANPGRIGRIVAHHLLEDQICGRGQTHCGTGVAVADLFHGVCRQYAYGIYRALVQVCPGQFFRMWHRCGPLSNRSASRNPDEGPMQFQS